MQELVSVIGSAAAHPEPESQTAWTGAQKTTTPLPCILMRACDPSTMHRHLEWMASRLRDRGRFHALMVAHLLFPQCSELVKKRFTTHTVLGLPRDATAIDGPLGTSADHSGLVEQVGSEPIVTLPFFFFTCIAE